jgi:heat shock protein 4
MKKVLNTVNEAHLNIECFMNDIDVKGYLKRAQYDELCQPLLERLQRPVEQALKSANITISQLNTVEAIGGGTRLSSVLNKLQDIVKITISQTSNREEAIARACALQVSIESS